MRCRSINHEDLLLLDLDVEVGQRFEVLALGRCDKV